MQNVFVGLGSTFGQMLLRSKEHRQKGFEMISMLICVVILSIMTWWMIKPSNPDGMAKATALMNYMRGVSDSLSHMRLDTGCYTFSAKNLWSLQTDTNNSCGQAITANTWSGIYMQPQPLDMAGLIKVDKIADGATLAIKSVSGGIGTRYYLEASGIPAPIVKSFVKGCNGAQYQAASNSGVDGFNNGKCAAILSAAEGGSTTMGKALLLIDETN